MTSDEMKIPIDPTRAKSLVEAVQGVSHRVDVAAGGRRNVCLPPPLRSPLPLTCTHLHPNQDIRSQEEEKKTELTDMERDR